MNENIINQNEHTIDVVVQSACPIDWLAEYYQNHKGKLIEIDDTFVDFIKNHADKVRIVEKKKENFARIHANFKAGVASDGTPFPATKLTTVVHGNAWIGDNQNRNFITRIDTDDIPGFGFKAKLDTSQIVHLRAETPKDFTQDKYSKCLRYIRPKTEDQSI